MTYETVVALEGQDGVGDLVVSWLHDLHAGLGCIAVLTVATGHENNPVVDEALCLSLSQARAGGSIGARDRGEGGSSDSELHIECQ